MALRHAIQTNKNSQTTIENGNKTLEATLERLEHERLALKRAEDERRVDDAIDELQRLAHGDAVEKKAYGNPIVGIDLTSIDSKQSFDEATFRKAAWKMHKAGLATYAGNWLNITVRLDNVSSCYDIPAEEAESIDGIEPDSVLAQSIFEDKK